MDKLVYEIQGLLKIADDAIDGLKAAFRQNCTSEENKEGLLAKNVSNFIDCINLDADKLHQLLDEEKVQCRESLAKVEEQVEIARQELMHMIEKQQSALQDYLEKFKDTQPKPNPEPKIFQMRQIGLFG